MDERSYEIVHLTTHLESAGDTGRLHRLLAMETGAGGNAWQEIKHRAGDEAGYLDDLMRAWRHADTVALQCRYALMHGSMYSREKNIAPEIVVRLISCGRWSLARGLAHIRAAADPRERLDSICQLMPSVSKSLQEQLFDEGVAEIERLRGRVPFPAEYQRERASRLCELLGAVADPKPVRLLEVLRVEAEAQELPSAIHDLVAALTPHTPANMVSYLDGLIARSAQHAGADPTNLGQSLHRLALRARLIGRMPAYQRADRAEDLLNLANRELERSEGSSSLFFVDFLRELFAQQPIPGLTLAVDRLAAEALAHDENGLGSGGLRTQLAARLLPLCSRGQQDELAEVVAGALAGAVSNFEFLIDDCVGQWPERCRIRLFDAAQQLESPYSQFKMVVLLAPLLPAAEARRAVDIAMTTLERRKWGLLDITEPERLAALSDKMTGAQRNALRTRIADARDAKIEMAVLAACYTVSGDAADRASLLKEALAAAARDSDSRGAESPLRQFIRKVAPMLSPEEAQDIVRDARAVRDESDFLPGVATALGFLEGDELLTTSRWALDILSRMADFPAAEMFQYLAPCIPASCYVAARGVADRVGGTRYRAHAYAALLLIPGLEPQDRDQLEKDARAAVEEIAEARAKPRVLALIARSCHDPQVLSEMARRALDAIGRIEYPTNQAEALLAAAPLISIAAFSRLADEVLTAARARKEVSFRDSLAVLAPRLPLEAIQKICATLLGGDFVDMGSAYIGVARRLAVLDCAPQALELLKKLPESSIPHAMEDIAPVLPRDAALDAMVMTMRVDHHLKDRGLAALAARFATLGDVPTAQALFENLTDAEAVVTAASALAQQVTEPGRSRLLATLPVRLKELTAPIQRGALARIAVPLRICDPEPRAQLLGDILAVSFQNSRAELVGQLYALTPVLNAIGGTHAVADLMQSIRHVTRWWP